MNFLAHLALSHFSAELQVGNFLGDFIRGRELDRLPPGVRRGVLLHREIDRLTDADPAVRALNARLATRHGRYAGVISDIGFDFFLYRNWDRCGPGDFADFCRMSYGHLRAARAVMSPRVAGYVDRMTADDWLQLYTTPAGMRRVFGRLRPRLSRPVLLDGVNDSLSDYGDAFNRTFLLLFPRLQQLADTYRE